MLRVLGHFWAGSTLAFWTSRNSATHSTTKLTEFWCWVHGAKPASADSKPSFSQRDVFISSRDALINNQNSFGAYFRVMNFFKMNYGLWLSRSALKCCHSEQPHFELEKVEVVINGCWKLLRFCFFEFWPPWDRFLWRKSQFGEKSEEKRSEQNLWNGAKKEEPGGLSGVPNGKKLL